MKDLKPIIAKNIIDLRKSRNLTQAELAQRLNYSDKAVSKWERAESVPDVAVLKEIADLFSVGVDFLLEAEHPSSVEQLSYSRGQGRNRLIITMLSTSLIFLIATIIFVIMGLVRGDRPHDDLWMIYMYAVPAALVVLLVFNALWGNRKTNFLIITLLVWSALLCLYLAFLAYHIWLIFIIGIPAQLIILLFAGLKPRNARE